MVRNIRNWTLGGAGLIAVLVGSLSLKHLSWSEETRSAESENAQASVGWVPGSQGHLDLTEEDFAEQPGDLPASFRGTEVDGQWCLDEQGNLMVTQDARRIFDYFLAATGEEPLERILQRIRRHIESSLQEPAAGQAQSLLADYIELLQKMSDFTESVGFDDHPDDLAQRLQRLMEVRRSYLTPEVADAFFGDEETYDRFTINQMRIEQDDQLDAQEKQLRQDELLSQLPDDMRNAIQSSQTAVHLQAQTRHWEARGGSVEELRQIRTELVGAEAADRLSKLDSKRQQWDRRMDDWFEVRQTLMEDTRMDESDREQTLARLRTEHFSEQEIRRVEALERIATH